ncbi:hypothetical protein B0H14DRAFT_3035964 [Mycena olivaceomarginata]|nr:hypothetical protein B0H14DRAFT_3035964 [Mycena olivaceomarginata]
MLIWVVCCYEVEWVHLTRRILLLSLPCIPFPSSTLRTYSQPSHPFASILPASLPLLLFSLSLHVYTLLTPPTAPSHLRRRGRDTDVARRRRRRHGSPHHLRPGGDVCRVARTASPILRMSRPRPFKHAAARAIPIRGFVRVGANEERADFFLANSVAQYLPRPSPSIRILVGDFDFDCDAIFPSFFGRG